MIDAVELLADGDDGVRAVGDCCYYEYFFDVVNDDAPSTWRELSTLTSREVHNSAGSTTS